jgi:thymidylate synthase
MFQTHKNPAHNFIPLSDVERAELTRNINPRVTRTPYMALYEKILRTGQWVMNERTGKRCLTIIGHSFEYDVANNILPLDTTRKSFAKMACLEITGYMRGFTSAAQFRDIGVKTWDGNANETPAWVNSLFRKGTDDIGRAYGPQARDWKDWQGNSIDQFKKVYDNLRAGKDDRGEIISFYNPGEFEISSLRPCMHTHQFCLLGDTLYLESFQRSCDVPLGLNFNQVQCFFFLKAMAQMTGLKPGTAHHRIANAHFYEDQIDTILAQINNQPFAYPSMTLDEKLNSLEYFENEFSAKDITVNGYQSHEAIAHAFSV